jgi:hypothetical protein
MSPGKALGSLSAKGVLRNRSENGQMLFQHGKAVF